VARASRGFLRYWVPVLAWMAVIVFGTSLARPPGLATLPESDKLLHAGAYAVLGVLLLRAFLGGSGYAAPLAAFLALVSGVVYGTADELHQALLPTRTCSARDLLADLTGLTAAVMVSWALVARLGKGGRKRGERTSTGAPEELSNVADVKELSEADFNSEVLNSGVPCLVDFWAPWCGPCHMVSPVVEKMAGEYEGKLKVAKVNLDQNPDLATKYGIRAIPAVLLFHEGDVADMIIGVQPEAAFRAAIDRVLGD
jgi:thioredoxin 1